MKFSYNWLQSFFKRKLPKPEKLAEILTMHSFEMENIEKRGNDWVLDIDVLPNRAGDCLSHLGVAREISVLLGYKILNPKFQVLNKSKIQNPKSKTKDSKVKDFVSVEVKDKIVCPRYCAKVITDVKISFSPKWLREKLEACGLRPINNVVDIANYVMLETGQPLHAFDFFKIESVQNSKFQIPNSKFTPPPFESRKRFSEEIKFLNLDTRTKGGGAKFKIQNLLKKIIVRFAKEGEKITTLDNEKYDLDENILIIADEKEPLAIAGIKGGKKAEITNSTKIVVLESANFNPQVVRRGSKTIDLKTDASWRFEHGIDPNLTEFAINRAAYLIQEIADGKVAKGLIDFYPQKVLPKKIKLDLDYVKNLLGVEISKKEIIRILKLLGLKIENCKLKILNVGIPTFRPDISIPEDLIEEIGRIYGYEKIPAQFPLAMLQPPKRNLEIFWENLSKDILKEVGFSEVYNYSFISEKDKEIFKCQNSELIEIENPISLEFQYLRPSLIPNLLKNIEKNQPFIKSDEEAEIKVFELGKIFYKCKMQNAKCKMTNQNAKILEKKVLTGVLVKDGEEFYQMKGIIDLLFQKLGISNIWYDEYQPTLEESKISIWQSKKCAEIKIENEKVGFLGEISSNILDDLKIETKTIIFDIDFEKLSRIASEEQEYQPISKYPAAVRDLAILVPRETNVEEVLNKIESTGGLLIRDIDLFDIYEGEELPEGKKNLAFHIIYHAKDRTLTSEEIDEIQNNIIKTLEEEPEWQVRR